MNLIRKWFQNDNIKKQGWLQAGKKQGTHYLFYQCGQPRSILNYLNGKLHGMQEYYFFTGQLKRRVEYNHGKKNGIMEAYNIEGELFLQCFYLDNKLHGEFYRHSDQQIERANYSRGILNGSRRLYEPMSMILQATDYVNNKKNGDSKVYTDDGILLKHLRYKDNKLHGECVEYSRGQVYCISHFKEGLKDGDFMLFYPDGKVEVKAKYRNNKPVMWKKFDENGKIKADPKLNS